MNESLEAEPEQHEIGIAERLQAAQNDVLMGKIAPGLEPGQSGAVISGLIAEYCTHFGLEDARSTNNFYLHFLGGSKGALLLRSLLEDPSLTEERRQQVRDDLEEIEKSPSRQAMKWLEETSPELFESTRFAVRNMEQKADVETDDGLQSTIAYLRAELWLNRSLQELAEYGDQHDYDILELCR